MIMHDSINAACKSAADSLADLIRASKENDSFSTGIIRLNCSNGQDIPLSYEDYRQTFFLSKPHTVIGFLKESSKLEYLINLCKYCDKHQRWSTQWSKHVAWVYVTSIGTTRDSVCEATRLLFPSSVVQSFIYDKCMNLLSDISNQFGGSTLYNLFNTGSFVSVVYNSRGQKSAFAHQSCKGHLDELGEYLGQYAPNVNLGV
jgi:hypothetical protein